MSDTFDAGTKSSGVFTPSFANGGLQMCTNDGPHTLTPPAESGSRRVFQRD